MAEPSPKLSRRDFIRLAGATLGAIAAEPVLTAMLPKRPPEKQALNPVEAHPLPTPEQIKPPSNTKEFVNCLIETKGGYWESLVKERKEFWQNNPEMQILAHQRLLTEKEINDLANMRQITFFIGGLDQGVDKEAGLGNRPPDQIKSDENDIDTIKRGNCDAPILCTYNMEDGKLTLTTFERDMLMADRYPVNTYSVTAAEDKQILGADNPAENMNHAMTIALGIRPDWSLLLNMAAYTKISKWFDKDTDAGQSLATMRNRDGVGPGERMRNIVHKLMIVAEKAINFKPFGIEIEAELKKPLEWFNTLLEKSLQPPENTTEGEESEEDKKEVSLNEFDSYRSNQTNPLEHLIEALDQDEITQLPVEKQKEFIMELIN